ncbi:MAG: hypothetical protein ACRDMX_10705 [Solirubrobacteraceae bacterium]
MPATTVSRTVHGPPISSAVRGLQLHRSYTVAQLAGAGIRLALRVPKAGTRMQATLRRGTTTYAGSPVLRAGRSRRVALALSSATGRWR